MNGLVDLAGPGRPVLPHVRWRCQNRAEPHRRFGEPIVDPGGYTAETLWDATNIEGGIEAAAEVYGVTIAEVRLANRYFDALWPNRAA